MVNKCKTKNDINENIILILILIILGVLTALKPNYVIGITLLIVLLYTLVLKTRTFFFAFAFLLFIQQSLIKTYYRFGLSMRESMIISRADDVIWLTFLFILLLKIKEYKEELKFEKIDISLLVLVLFSFLSLFINKRPIFWGSVSILLMIKGYLMYFVGDKLKFSEKDIKRFIIYYTLALLLICIIGILQYFNIYTSLFPPGYRFGLKVINSIFGTHTAFGSIMVIGATLIITFIIGSKKIELFPLLLLFLWGIILSTSRRSLISFLIILFLLPYITQRVSKRIYIPFSILVVILFIVFRNQLTVLVTSTSIEYFRDFLATARGELYLGMMRILKSKPLFGEGPGSFAGLVARISGSRIPFKYGLTEKAIHYSSDAYPAHILGELGIVGGVLYSLLFYHIFRKISEIQNHFESYNDTFFISVSIYLKSVFIIGILESFVSSFFEVTVKSFAFFGIFAMVSSFYKHLKK